MEYKAYNSETCLCDRARMKTMPYIRVKKRNYYVAISREVWPILGMDADDVDNLRIEFLNNPDRPDEWFVRKSGKGIKVRQTTQGRLYISNKELVMTILDKCREYERVTFLVAREPVEEGSDIHALLWRKGENIKLRSR